jgi:hypothetical protein
VKSTFTFEEMIELLRTFTPRDEIILEEVPAPQKLAAYSFAFTADISNGQKGDAEDEVASGRFVILHEPGGQDTWEGDFRCVTFMRADVDSEMQLVGIGSWIHWDPQVRSTTHRAEQLLVFQVHLLENFLHAMMTPKLKFVLRGPLSSILRTTYLLTCKRGAIS